MGYPQRQCSCFCRRQKSVATARSPIASRPARNLVTIPTELQNNLKVLVLGCEVNCPNSGLNLETDFYVHGNYIL